ncbi:MAG: VWA domain-containing protein [Treponema sp.]|jgi:hypothetical protein|nr:VWA domain-containing protein [Treponema sp.]
MRKSWLLVIVLELLGLVLSTLSCSNTPKTPSDPPGETNRESARAESQEGIYIGLLSFASDVQDLSGGTLIYLNEEGRNQLLQMLSQYNRASGSGTALYYAVHQALSNLTKHEPEFSDNLGSINLFTFTDGLDNNSTSLALPMIEEQDFRGKSTSAYASYIMEQIAERRIAGKRITAFAAGVPGNDVEDRAAFTTTLESLASTSGTNDQHYYELSNFSELNQKFQDIANNLTIINRDLTFKIITPSYQPGTKIRMTFDVAEQTLEAFSKATRYVEGEVSINDATYTLTNIAYSEGVSSSSEGPVPGTLQGTEVSYIFNDFRVTDAKWNLQQWILSPGATTWQRNSEYTMGDSLKIAVEKRSSVIYLVLDNSRSLVDTDVASIRNAVESFINLLYLKLYPGSAVSSSTPGNQTILNLQNNIWKDDTITSGGYRYYRFHAEAGQSYLIRWNDSLEGDSTKTADILVTIYREDTNTSLHFGVDSGFKNPPRISVTENTDILIEVKGHTADQATGTFAIMYQPISGLSF